MNNGRFRMPNPTFYVTPRRILRSTSLTARNRVLNDEKSKGENERINHERSKK